MVGFIKEALAYKQRNVLYLLVLANCMIYIFYLGMVFHFGTSILTSCAQAFLLPGLFLIVGINEYQQSFRAAVKLDAESLVIGVLFSALALFMLLSKNWHYDQISISDICIFGGLCSFMKDHVLNLVKTHT